MKEIFKQLSFGLAAVLVCGLAFQPAAGRAQEPVLKTYVGSQACADCHEHEFKTFSQHARKSKSFHSVEMMKKGLTAEELRGCYKCHTTGYGEPGGFVSVEKTPHLQNAGCEVCHGPGSLHVESEDPDDIISEVSMENCIVCHNSERVAAFNFKPLLYGGAH